MVTTANDAADDFLERSSVELKALSVDLLWTEKIHLAHAERLSKVHLSLGLGTTVLAAISAATVVAEGAPVVAATCALLAAILSGVSTFMKPDEMSSRHLTTGRQMNSLRVRIRQYEKLHLTPGTNAEDITSALEKFAADKTALDEPAPSTSEWAYRVAKEKIEEGHFDNSN